MFIIESPDEIGRDSIGSNSSNEVAKFVASETLFDEPTAAEGRRDDQSQATDPISKAINSTDTN